MIIKVTERKQILNELGPKPIKQIQDYLEKTGVRTKKGKPISKSQINLTLSGERFQKNIVDAIYTLLTIVMAKKEARKELHKKMAKVEV